MVKGDWVVRPDAATGRPLDYGEVVNLAEGQVKVQLYDSTGDFRGEPIWCARDEAERWWVLPNRRAAMEKWGRSVGGVQS